MFRIDEGKQIDRSEEQPPNADSPRIETAEPGSKITFERPVQPPQQSAGIVSIDEGIQID
jgi:hypothetical protein